MSYCKKIASGAVALVAIAAPVLSHAALPESVTTAITSAQTDGVMVLGLMIGVSVGVWGLRRVMGLFGR